MTDEFVICPFNRSHIISRLRIQYHLVKCKKNYPLTKKLVCPYDATEYIDPSKYTAHLCQCKKKKRLDVTEEFRQKQYELIQHGDLSIQTFFSPGVLVTDEWDVKQSDGEEHELTRDELKSIELKNETSKALQRACAFAPVVPHPVGRGSRSDLYQNYISNLPQTPENTIFTQSVAYFPLGNIKSQCSDADESNFDSSTEDEAIYSDRVKEIDEKEIYEDMEEQIDASKQKSSGKIKMNSLVNDYNNHPKICDSLKYQSMGRGTIGRGALIGRGVPQNPSISNSRARTLDNILKEVILVKMLEDNSSSKYKSNCVSLESHKPNHSSSSHCVNTATGVVNPNCVSTSTLLVRSTSSNASVGLNCSSIVSKESHCDMLSVSSSSSDSDSVKSFPSTSYALSDEAIKFPKSSRQVVKNNSSNVLVNDITGKFQLTSIEDKRFDKIGRKESDASNKGRQNAVKQKKETFSIPCLGRGRFLADNFLH